MRKFENVYRYENSCNNKSQVITTRDKASIKLTTLCPSNMYFLLYSTLKSIFVDKFGYPCTIGGLFDLEKKNEANTTSEGYW